MKKKNIASLILAFVLIITLLNGCGNSDIVSDSRSSSDDILSESSSSSSSSSLLESNDEESASNYNDSSIDADNEQTDSESNSITNEENFSLSDVPEYSGSPFVEINDNVPFFEDKGQSIQFNVFCYHVQPGTEIDYATGDSKEIE